MSGLQYLKALVFRLHGESLRQAKPPGGIGLIGMLVYAPRSRIYRYIRCWALSSVAKIKCGFFRGNLVQEVFP